MKDNLCKCGGDVYVYEPVVMRYAISKDSTIDWACGEMTGEYLRELAEVECNNCGKKFTLKGEDQDRIVGKEKRQNDHMTSIPMLMETKHALVDVYFDDKVHVSWEVEEGKVVSFEYVPENYPAGGLSTWQDKREYVDAIKDCGWIVSGISESFQPVDQEIKRLLLAENAF